MKFLRVLLFASTAIIVLILVGVGVAFNSSFQTWATRRALAAQPDLKADVGRVSVGLNRIELGNIRLVRPGMILTLPSATVDVSAIKAAGKKVDVKKIVAHGWTLDLTAPAKVAGSLPPGRKGLAGYVAVLATVSAAPAEKSAAFHGIFGRMKLPVELSLDRADLAGEVIFPTEADKPPGRAKVTLTGGQLGAGKEGSFTVVADATLTGAVTSLSSRSQIGIRMDTPSSIDRIAATTEAKAIGAQFPNGAELQSNLKAERGTQGAETYRLVATSGGRTLVSLDAELPSGAARLDGKVVLAVRDTDLSPFALGRPVPTFVATADTKFWADTAFERFGASGTLDLAVSKLEAIQKELGTVGALKINATFALEHTGTSLRVTTLQARVDGVKPLATVDVRQAFEYILESGELRVADANRDLVALTVEVFPLAWAQPFLGKLALTGGEARGAFVVRAAGGGFSVRPQAPFTVSSFSLSQDGNAVLRDVSLSLNPSADVTPKGWQAEIADFSARSGSATLLSLSAKAGQVSGDKQPVKATGSFAVDLPGTLAQPVAAGAVRLSRGAAKGQFTLSSGEKQEVATQVVISDLAAANQESLPKVSIDLRADIAANGQFAAQMPLLVEQAGRKSDLSIDAKGKSSSAGVEVEARVSSTLVHVNDMKSLLLPLAGDTKAKPTRPTPSPTPDTKPVWAGVKGKLSLALQQVIYSPDLTVRDINGTVSIAEAAVTLEALKAVLGTGGQLAVSGGVTFVPATAKPYTLKADIAVSNLDSGATLKAFSSGPALPLVEGKFDLASKVSASGPNLASLADQARGDVKISSKGGLFRPVPSNYVEALGSARTQILKRTEQVSAISSLAGALGAKLPGNLGGTTAKIQSLAERIGDLEAIVKLIAEVKFDQLTFDAGGDNNLDTVLRDLTITAPELRFVGAGGLKYQPNVPLWKQALSLKLNGAARGKAAEVMKKGNLLGEQVDGLGYTPLSLAIDVDGTAEKPDTSKLVASLIEKVLSLKLEPGEIEKIRQGDIASLLALLGQLK